MNKQEALKRIQGKYKYYHYTEKPKTAFRLLKERNKNNGNCSDWTNGGSIDDWF